MSECPKSCLGYANKIFWGISGDDFGKKNMLLRQASQSDSFIFILILPLFMKIGCKNDQSTRNNCNYHYLLRQDDTI
jgi:hypothetical protein